MQALMIETLSVSFACHVHVEHAHESVLRLSFHVWIMCLTQIAPVFEMHLIKKAINISSVFHVFMFIILYFESNFFFLIDCLDCLSKLYCYTDFLVKY